MADMARQILEAELGDGFSEVTYDQRYSYEAH